MDVVPNYRCANLPQQEIGQSKISRIRGKAKNMTRSTHQPIRLRIFVPDDDASPIALNMRN